MSSRRLLKYRNGPRCCSILVAKARVQHGCSQRSRPSEQRGPAPKATHPSGREAFRYLNGLLSGPDLSEDSAKVRAKDQFDVRVRIAPANQTISDVKHTLIMIHAIGVHFIAESVTGFIEAP